MKVPQHSMPPKFNKIILTGVAGFIGSNLAKQLLALGHHVIGIDKLLYGSMHNVEPLLAHPHFRFLERDVRFKSTLANLSPDALMHLASYKIPRYTDALDTLEINDLMIRNVGGSCVEKGMKLVFSSTSDGYGKNPHVPFHENCDLVIGPTTVKRWAYAVSKIFSEQVSAKRFSLSSTPSLPKRVPKRPVPSGARSQTSCASNSPIWRS